jgi:hypothetical protein
LGIIRSRDAEELSFQRYGNRLSQFVRSKERSEATESKSNAIENLECAKRSLRETDEKQSLIMIFAKIRTQMFRDLIEWQKAAPESRIVNMSSPNESGKRAKAREKLMSLP